MRVDGKGFLVVDAPPMAADAQAESKPAESKSAEAKTAKDDAIESVKQAGKNTGVIIISVLGFTIGIATIWALTRKD